MDENTMLRLTLWLLLFAAPSAHAQMMMTGAGKHPAPTQMPTTSLKWLLDASAGVYHDAGVTPATNGQTAVQWNDQSANGNNAAGSGACSPPVYNTSQVNSLPALTFNGTNTCFLVPDASEPGTIHIVYRTSGSAFNYQALMGQDTSDAVSLGAFYLWATQGYSGTNNANGYNNGQLYNRITNVDTSGTAPGVWNVSANSVIGAWDLMSVRNDGTNITLYKRCVKMGSSASRGANTARPLTGTASIGASYYTHTVNSGAYLAGQVALAAKYSPNQSDTDFATSCAYLLSHFNFATTPQRFVWLGFEGLNTNINLIALTGPNGHDFTQVLPTYYMPPTGHVVHDVGAWWDSVHSLWWISYLTSTSGTTQVFDIAKSTDPGPPSYPITFTFVKSVDVSAVVPGTGAAYSPRFFKDIDGSIHVTFTGVQTVPTTGMQPYEIHPTDANDFSAAWSTPVLVTGTGLAAKNGYDFGWNYYSGTYEINFTNQPNGFIERWTSASPFSGFTLADAHVAGIANYEGTQIFKNPAGLWEMSVDQFGNDNSYTTSADRVTWSGTTVWTHPLAPFHPQGGGGMMDLQP